MIPEYLLMAPKKCIDDALVNEGAAAPKRIPPVEVCMLPSATSGLLPVDTVSTAMKLLSDQDENQPDKLQPACLSLLEEGHRNKIKANSGV